MDIGLNCKIPYHVKPQQKSVNYSKLGIISMINIPVWMFLSSYERLRRKLLDHCTFSNMSHFGRGLFGSDFGTTAFVICNEKIEGYKGHYKKLYDKQGA